MRFSLLEYAKLIRLPGLGGFSMGPIFGAVSLIDIGVEINLKILFLLFLIGVFKSIFGIVLNDYADIEIDRLSEDSSKRPLVIGTISKKTALIISVISIVVIFLIPFIFFYRNHISFYLSILCIIVAVIFGVIYDLYGKRIIGSDFLVGTVEGLLVLIGAFLISPDGILSIFTWVIFILVFTQYLFMNAVIGGLKDADHDYLMNVKNIALACGVKVSQDNKIFIPMNFKAFALGIRFFSSFVIFVPFAFGIHYEIWEFLLLAILVVVVLYSTIKLLNIKILEKKGKSAKLAAIQGVLRYLYVPILLVLVIGLFYSFILIIFPLLWFIVFRITVMKDYFAT